MLGRKCYRPNRVTDYLLIGDALNARNLSQLQEYRVTHILNCTAEVPCYFPGIFTYCQLPLHDDEKEPDPEPFFWRGHRFLEGVRQRRRVVLVHCQMGISRSASIVLFHLLHHGMDANQAYNYLYRKRPVIGPHVHYWKLIERVSRQLFRR